MKHLLLTRFNVVIADWKSQVNLDPSWLDERFKLFDELCAPSVLAQSNQDFDWLIFFDSHTPERYKSRIQTLQKVYRFHPIYVDVFNLERMSAIIFDIYAGDEMLLTSRLDSDDILAIDYIEKVQSATAGLSGKRVINFDQGVILFSKNNKYSLYQYTDNSNPFTSLLEPFVKGFSTILAVSHIKLHQFAEVHHINGKPMWLQLVHGGNVSNRVRGVRVKLNQYNKDFHYIKTISKGHNESDFEIRFDNYVLGSYRSLRDLVRTVAKRLYMWTKDK